MTDPAVLYSEDRHVATILFNRPKTMNASSRQLRADFGAALEKAERSEDVRVVVLMGEGRSFGAGADLSESFVDEHATVTDHILKDHLPLIDAIGASEKTFIAALHGATAGISIAYALNSDLVVMSESAFIYSPFAAIGLIPDGGVTWFLVQALGYRRAFEVCAEGKRLSASQCLVAGLVNKIVTDDALRSEAAAWAHHLADTVAPLSLRYMKRAMRAALGDTLGVTQRMEAELQHRCVTSSDAAEGISAFMQKRKPNFTGR